MKKLLTVIIAVTTLGASNAFGEASFQGLGWCGNYCTAYAGAISADGSVIVGRMFSAWTGTYGAWRWTEETGFMGLPALPTPVWPRSNFANGVSADGAVIVGNSISVSPGSTEACRWIAPTYSVQGLGYPPSGSAGSVSADGSVIVGTNSDDGAFRWTEATGMVGLGGGPSSSAIDVSADGSVVVGTWNEEAFRWTAATGMVGLGYLSGTSNSEASGVSQDGLVVVGSCGYSWSDYQEAFRWTAATGMVGLGHLPGASKSQARGVSGDGSVIVGICDNQAFVWDAVNGMRNLQDVLVNDFGLDLTGWVQLYDAADISADGQRIVGTGVHPNGYAGAWLATIPSLAMPIPISLDIKPGACPNPLNVKHKGMYAWTEDKGTENPIAASVTDPYDPSKAGAVVPVAILGTEEFDVADIDVSTVMLEGLVPIRSSFEDVATPVGDTTECACTAGGPDGFVDLTLKFDRAAIIAALGEVHDGDVIPLTIIGELNDGTAIEGTDCVVIIGDSEPSDGAPPSEGDPEIHLIGNYPNPFNPTTEISFILPNAMDVKLEVYNIIGQRVTTLVNERLEAGKHVVQWDGSEVASGVYLYRLTTADYAETKKMLLLK